MEKVVSDAGPGRASSPADLLMVIQGVAVVISGVYLVTLSVVVTVIAAIAAVALAALGLSLYR